MKWQGAAAFFTKAPLKQELIERDGFSDFQLDFKIFNKVDSPATKTWDNPFFIRGIITCSDLENLAASWQMGLHDIFGEHHLGGCFENIYAMHSLSKGDITSMYFQHSYWLVWCLGKLDVLPHYITSSVRS